MGRTEAERSRTLDELLACDCDLRERQVCDKCQLLRPAVARLRAERDRLAAALRTYCVCVSDGLAPTTGHDCPKFPCRAGVALKQAAVDAAGCLKGEGER